jgi:hypothetical protein
VWWIYSSKGLANLWRGKKITKKAHAGLVVGKKPKGKSQFKTIFPIFMAVSEKTARFRPLQTTPFVNNFLLYYPAGQSYLHQSDNQKQRTDRFVGWCSCLEAPESYP